jgi:hypothetical protein
MFWIIKISRVCKFSRDVRFINPMFIFFFLLIEGFGSSYFTIGLPYGIEYLVYFRKGPLRTYSG